MNVQNADYVRRIDSAAKVLEREWAKLTHCCYFSELRQEAQNFWRPVIRRWAELALRAAEGERTA